MGRPDVWYDGEVRKGGDFLCDQSIDVDPSASFVCERMIRRLLIASAVHLGITVLGLIGAFCLYWMDK